MIFILIFYCHGIISNLQSLEDFREKSIIVVKSKSICYVQLMIMIPLLCKEKKNTLRGLKTRQ